MDEKFNTVIDYIYWYEIINQDDIQTNLSTTNYFKEISKDDIVPIRKYININKLNEWYNENKYFIITSFDKYYQLFISNNLEFKINKELLFKNYIYLLFINKN
jgi:hypothetical protein